MEFFSFTLSYYLASGLLCFSWIILGFVLFYLYKFKNKELQKTMSNSEFDNLIAKAILESESGNKEELIDMAKGLGIIALIPGIGIVYSSLIFLSLILVILTYKKDLSELLQEIKTDTSKDYIPIIKKYFKNETPFLRAILEYGNHPYNQLIKDNLIELLEIIKDKESELELTLNKTREKNIKNDITNLISKFNKFTRKLNTNFIKTEREKMKSFNKDITNLNNKFKEKTFIIEDFLNYYNLPNKNDKYQIEVKTELLSTYFNENDKDICILKKLLNINENVYCNSIMEVTDILTDTINLIETKINFMNFDLRHDIEEEIKETIRQYILLLTNLDNVYIPTTDKRVTEYEELLDSVIKDIENKKAIF